jgi:hypothetical protein
LPYERYAIGTEGYSCYGAAELQGVDEKAAFILIMLLAKGFHEQIHIISVQQGCLPKNKM